MYESGQGVAQSYAEAMKWYRKAADQSDAQAQFNLGTKYYRGEGVQQDYDKALMWIRKAADQGNAVAQRSLGVMYNKGQGVTRDSAETSRWYRKAADQGGNKDQEAPPVHDRAASNDLCCARVHRVSIRVKGTEAWKSSAS